MFYLFVLQNLPKKYRTIWINSRLSTIGSIAKARLQTTKKRLDPSMICALAMSYGNPSISKALEKIKGAKL